MKNIRSRYQLINGFKKPSVEREKAILAHIHQLGEELMAANF